jgi:DNA polymerase-3 subunit epsilon
MVPIRAGVIRYGERFGTLVRPPDGAPLSTEGVRAHGLIPDEVRAAPTLAEVLPEIDRRIRAGVLLVHHAQVDLPFLEAAYRAVSRPWPRPHVIDTVDLVWTLYRRRHRLTPHAPPARLSLEDARRDVGLPPHVAHDALADALATAELYLALRVRLEGW